MNFRQIRTSVPTTNTAGIKRKKATDIVQKKEERAHEKLILELSPLRLAEIIMIVALFCYLFVRKGYNRLCNLIPQGILTDRSSKFLS